MRSVKVAVLALMAAALLLLPLMRALTVTAERVTSPQALSPTPAMAAPLAAVGGCMTPQFVQAPGSPFGAVLGSGKNPSYVVVGDFNLDGKPDLAVTNFSSNDVTIRRGDGSGSFPLINTSTIAVGTSPIAAAVGDFNRDGKQDLAVANFGDDNLTILLGNGTGGFIPAPNVGANNGPIAVAVGDFNRDGNEDLAVANQLSNDVTIRLGDGAGGFPNATATNVGAGSGPVSVAVGDFDDDGKQDLAVSNAASNNLTIRRGDGAGGFPNAAASTVSAGGAPQTVVVGDFNSDGKQDLAVPNALDDNVMIRPGDGAGGFPDATATNVGAGDSPTSLTIADFNGDGKQDMAVPSQDSNDVTIRLGDGAGTFPDANSLAVGVGLKPEGIAAGDFNLDGKQDFAVANFNNDNVTVQLNTCVPDCADARFFQPAGSPIDAGDGPGSVGIGDFNDDGKPDLAVGNRGDGDVTILLGDSAGGFTEPASSPVTVGDTPFALVVSDFNNDGKQDLAVVNADDDNVTILLGDGAGDFTEPTASPITVGDGPRSIATGDFNNDGRQDLAVGNDLSNNVTILLGDGAGGFTQPPAVTVLDSNITTIVVADFNNDGKQDLATGDFTYTTVRVLLGDGAGGFTEPATSPIEVGEGPFAIAAGDLNNDGRQDLAAPKLFERTARGVSILLNACVDLAITKTDTPDPVLAGNEITYNLTVTNNGSIPVPDVVVTDQLAPSTTFFSANPSQGGCTGTTLITCNLGSIDAGDSATIKIVAKTTIPTLATNTAIVNSAAFDPDRSNNADREPTKVVGLKSLSFSPTLFMGGCWFSSYNATVTLTGPAPAGGVVVQLSDDSPNVNNPAAVKVEAGKTTAIFRGGAGAVSNVQEVTFTATAGATTVKKKLTVLPIRVAALSLAPSTIRGGNPVTGTVRLTCAPASDTTVMLSSSRWAAWLPARQLTVPAGHPTRQFTVNTLQVTSPIDALITATANGTLKTATLHVVP